MKTLFLIPFAFLLFTHCKDAVVDNKNVGMAIVAEKTLAIENIEVLKKELILNQLEGKWYYKNVPFSGYSLVFYSNDTLAEKIGFVNGKREGIARQWSEKGVLRVESDYKHNRLDNVYKTWWDNGVLSSQSNYIACIKQGIEEEWYPTGQLAKQRQLIDGQEQGLQKAWLQNGTLYVNYEAKNGRIFGMRKANSCYKLENEVVNKDEKI
jgi:antitoxin component YwqK of YwqJK toxin-antitoxin module